VREEQILRCLAKGFSNKQIGLALKLSEKTVKRYVTDVMQKLKVRNRVEAALLAAKRYGPANSSS
jgi:two-component system nitrate/nitrite response regulator NarL